MYYQELFPYYFPRNSGDYKFQMELPDCMGGQYGEPLREGAHTSHIKAHCESLCYSVCCWFLKISDCFWSDSTSDTSLYCSRNRVPTYNFIIVLKFKGSSTKFLILQTTNYDKNFIGLSFENFSTWLIILLHGSIRSVCYLVSCPLFYLWSSYLAFSNSVSNRLRGKIFVT